MILKLARKNDLNIQFKFIKSLLIELYIHDK